MQFSRITMDPAVMGGKACIRGLRVTVGTIVGLIAAGRSIGLRSSRLIPTSSPKTSTRRWRMPHGESKNAKSIWLSREHRDSGRHEPFP